MDLVVFHRTQTPGICDWLSYSLAAPPPLCFLLPRMDLSPVHPPLSPCLVPCLSSHQHCSWLEGRERRGCIQSSLAHVYQVCQLTAFTSTRSIHSATAAAPVSPLRPSSRATTHRSQRDSEVNSWVFLVAGHFAGRDRSPLNWAFPEPDDWGLCFLGFVCSFCPLAAPCAQGWEEQSQVTCLIHQG